MRTSRCMASVLRHGWMAIALATACGATGAHAQAPLPADIQHDLMENARNLAPIKATWTLKRSTSTPELLKDHVDLKAYLHEESAECTLSADGIAVQFQYAQRAAEPSTEKSVEQGGFAFTLGGPTESSPLETASTGIAFDGSMLRHVKIWGDPPVQSVMIRSLEDSLADVAAVGGGAPREVLVKRWKHNYWQTVGFRVPQCEYDFAEFQYQPEILAISKGSLLSVEVDESTPRRLVRIKGNAPDGGAFAFVLDASLRHAVVEAEFRGPGGALWETRTMSDFAWFGSESQGLWLPAHALVQLYRVPLPVGHTPTYATPIATEHYQLETCERVVGESEELFPEAPVGTFVSDDRIKDASGKTATFQVPGSQATGARRGHIFWSFATIGLLSVIALLRFRRQSARN